MYSTLSPSNTPGLGNLERGESYEFIQDAVAGSSPSIARRRDPPQGRTRWASGTRHLQRGRSEPNLPRLSSWASRLDQVLSGATTPRYELISNSGPVRFRFRCSLLVFATLLVAILTAAGVAASLYFKNPKTPSTAPPTVPDGEPIPGYYNGPLRPQVHYSPPQNFMNDPNGMFLDEDGVYHLYYQYNPTAPVAGNQHWGHATSEDLYHWDNQPIAIYPGSPEEGIFSGTCVVDVNNTSGFFPDQKNGVVAIYTSNTPGSQNQQIAYSTDGGYTFTKYSGGSVLSVDSDNFRDPQVTWHAETQRWVMVVAYSQEFVIGIFTSTNFVNWEYASNFSHHGLLGNQYECPNLVQIPMEGTSEMLYLLIVSINPGAPVGGSITQYFVGSFDGQVFTPIDGAARIADFGKDNYAGQFFYGLPEGSKPVSLAWTSNWQYTNDVPTGPLEGWRSSMSLPRVNMLKNISRLGYDLISKPYDFSGLYDEPLAQNPALGNGSFHVEYPTLQSNTVYLQATFTGMPRDFPRGVVSFSISSSVSGESLRGGFFLSSDTQFWVDRSNTHGFDNPFFTDKFSTSTFVAEGTFMLEVIVDRSLLEIFLNDGQQSATLSFFPKQPLDTIDFTTVDLDPDTEVSVAVFGLRSTWATKADANGIVMGQSTRQAAVKRLPESKSTLPLAAYNVHP